MTTLCKKLFGWMRKESKPFIRFYSLESGTATLFPIVKSASVSRSLRDTDADFTIGNSVAVPDSNE